MNTNRYKEEFVEAMDQANLSNYEYVILAKRLGLDGKVMGYMSLAKMLGFDKNLVKRICKRAINKVFAASEDRGGVEFLLWKILKEKENA